MQIWSKNGGDRKKVMIFYDSRTNPSEEGEDDKNHDVPNEPIAKKTQKNMSTTEFEPTHGELNWFQTCCISHSSTSTFMRKNYV